MLDFFFALFGGLYYGARLISENASEKRYFKSQEEKFAFKTEREDRWRAIASDRALEEDLSHFIITPENYDKVWGEVRKAYQQMPVWKHRTGIPLFQASVPNYYGTGHSRKQREQIAMKERDQALDIMLARRGKVRYCYTGGDYPMAYLQPCAGEHSKREWEKRFEFWSYINDELHRHGIPSRLIFAENRISDRVKTAYDVDNPDLFRYKQGYLQWLHTSWFDDNLHPL